MKSIAIGASAATRYKSTTMGHGERHPGARDLARGGPAFDASRRARSATGEAAVRLCFPLFLASAVLGLCTSVSGCDLTVSATASIGQVCSVDTDCASGQICVIPEMAGSSTGTCAALCASDSHCGSGLACKTADVAGRKACVVPPADATVPTEPDGTAEAQSDTTIEEAEAGGEPGDGQIDGPDTADADARADAGDADATLVDAPEGDDAADGSIGPDADASDVSTDGPDAEAGPSVCEAGSPPTTLVLFGGAGISTQYLGDTWIFDGASWSSVGGDAGAAGPPGRSGAVMTTACGVAVLFGGIAASQVPLADAWQWNGATWTPVTSSPEGRYGAAAGTLGDAVYVFGGETSPDGGASASQVVSAPDSLLAWSGSNWSSPGPPSLGRGPTPSLFATLTQTRSGLLLFGGSDVTGLTVYGETWLLTGTLWLPPVADAATSPPARSNAAAASWGAGMVLFGGYDENGSPLPDTWIWDGSTWTVQRAQSDGPAIRAEAVMGSLNGKVVLFGGLDANLAFLGDTWIWDGSWTRGPDAGPPARANAAMAAH
jgi:Galactose oxidase, central domain